jgi:hypothetical protein
MAAIAAVAAAPRLFCAEPCGGSAVCANPARTANSTVAAGSPGSALAGDDAVSRDSWCAGADYNNRECTAARRRGTAGGTTTTTGASTTAMRTDFVPPAGTIGAVSPAARPTTAAATAVCAG